MLRISPVVPGFDLISLQKKGLQFFCLLETPIVLYLSINQQLINKLFHLQGWYWGETFPWKEFERSQEVSRPSAQFLSKKCWRLRCKGCTVSIFFVFLKSYNNFNECFLLQRNVLFGYSDLFGLIFNNQLPILQK